MCEAADERARTLARFQAHRLAWHSNPTLRVLYQRWYDRVRAQLPAQGPWIELGSGPGFARDFVPGLTLTDLVVAPWHDRQVDAQSLPFSDGSVGALVLFDVLHHLPAPARFFGEAVRVLRPGGRIVFCEPYLSPLSYPVYRFFHEEDVVLRVDPLAEAASISRDPFESNQAIPTLLFSRGASALTSRFPSLRLTHLERLAGPAYPASGGFSRRPLLPRRLWNLLLTVEDHLPAPLFRLIGFRLLAVLERQAEGVQDVHW
jgi:SAM-dependent methyltransferase